MGYGGAFVFFEIPRHGVHGLSVGGDAYWRLAGRPQRLGYIWRPSADLFSPLIFSSLPI